MRRKPLLFLGLILLGVAVYLALRHFLTLEIVLARETQLRSWMSHHRLRAFLAGLAIYTLLSFVPGTTGKSLVFGWLFGFWIALLQVNLALTAAALGSFFLSRYFLRDAVRSRFGFYIDRFDNALARDGGSYVIALRLLHVPYTFVNYAFGATSIRWITFWWSSQLGMLPGNIVFVLAGAQLPSLRALSHNGLHAMFSPTLILSFVLMAGFHFVVQRWIRRWRATFGIDTTDQMS